MKQITYDYSNEEIEIGGKVYRFNVSDEALINLEKGGALEVKAKELTGEKLNNLDTGRRICSEYINAILEGDPFDEIYQNLGKSLVRVMYVLPQIIDAYTFTAKEHTKEFKGKMQRK